MIKTLQKKFVITAMAAITVLVVVLLGTVNICYMVHISNENTRMLNVLSGNGRVDDFKPDFLYTDIQSETDATTEMSQSGQTEDTPAVQPQQTEDTPAVQPQQTGDTPAAMTKPDEDMPVGPADEDMPAGPGDEKIPGNMTPTDADNIKPDDSEEGEQAASTPQENHSSAPSDNNNIFDHYITEDNTMSAIYFYGELNEEGDIMYVSVDRISSVDESGAEEYITGAYSKYLKKGKSSLRGKTGSFRYVVNESTRGNGYTVVFLDTSNQTRNEIIVLVVSVGIGVICLLLMLLLVVFLSKKAIRPIAENIEKQKQFITDAGHEIKTPLAIILTNTDAMELCTGETKWSQNIRKQTKRLSGLMQELLSLSRMEEQNLVLSKENLDMGELVNDFLNQFDENAKSRNVTVIREIDEDICVKADKDSVSKTVNILIDNACKYAKEGGYIKVKLYQKDKKCTLKVENDSDVKLEGDPNKMFDRFYRGDSARTQKSGGYGVGLSIARAAVIANGGSMKAEYRNENVVVFTVKL